MADSSRKEIEDLVELLNRYHLTELEVEKKGVRVRVRRDAAPAVSAPVAEPSFTLEAASPSPLLHSSGLPADLGQFLTVSSPIVGTFYRASSPDASPYVEEGDIVKKGQVLCIVEAMKLMNEIEAEADGRIVKILVESTTPVEFGQPLFLIDPQVSA
ncbi:MAG: acetyl-CoA carboxylase biotin carboxyl carrier protein [Nitrospira sp.]|nr:acetyl-CoA carboxylase biotin carboxyl carrier protein [Nitrospira sp.]MCA9479096.1 acetyl-CoA carboxylase biotin carboxyl carrier protein [Nitrospira sp.]MCB9711902.1 acetyl-CoA carboxylase biotin carboxyl carrier protein [Nitrospiraceae bacterium]